MQLQSVILSKLEKQTQAGPRASLWGSARWEQLGMSFNLDSWGGGVLQIEPATVGLAGLHEAKGGGQARASSLVLGSKSQKGIKDICWCASGFTLRDLHVQTPGNC